jgi:hypothetical protein
MSQLTYACAPSGCVRKPKHFKEPSRKTFAGSECSSKSGASVKPNAGVIELMSSDDVAVRCQTRTVNSVRRPTDGTNDRMYGLFMPLSLSSFLAVWLGHIKDVADDLPRELIRVQCHQTGAS